MKPILVFFLLVYQLRCSFHGKNPYIYEIGFLLASLPVYSWHVKLESGGSFLFTSLYYPRHHHRHRHRHFAHSNNNFDYNLEKRAHGILCKYKSNLLNIKAIMKTLICTQNVYATCHSLNMRRVLMREKSCAIELTPFHCMNRKFSGVYIANRQIGRFWYLIQPHHSVSPGLVSLSSLLSHIQKLSSVQICTMCVWNIHVHLNCTDWFFFVLFLYFAFSSLLHSTFSVFHIRLVLRYMAFNLNCFDEFMLCELLLLPDTRRLITIHQEEAYQLSLRKVKWRLHIYWFKKRKSVIQVTISARQAILNQSVCIRWNMFFFIF